MSARDVIAGILFDADFHEPETVGWSDQFESVREKYRLRADRLTAAGFSIVHKDEIHAPSVERAIAVALAHIQQPGMTDNPAYVHFEPADAMAKKIAADLRELMKEVSL